MKNLIFVIAISLIVFSSASKADWKLFGVTNESIFYIDDDEIKKIGSSIILWVMIDYIVKDEWNNQSMILNMEFNCNKKENRSKTYYLFSGRKGSGTVTETGYENSQWILPPPGSTYFRMMDAYCGK